MKYDSEEISEEIKEKLDKLSRKTIRKYLKKREIFSTKSAVGCMIALIGLWVGGVFLFEKLVGFPLAFLFTIGIVSALAWIVVVLADIKEDIYDIKKNLKRGDKK